MLKPSTFLAALAAILLGVALTSALPTPVAYWDFEDSAGTTLTDKSGHGINGVITGPVVSAQGVRGKALVFDGSTSVQIPEGLIGLPGGFTLSAWIWQPDLDLDFPVLEFCCTNDYSGLHIWANTTGNSVVAPGAVLFNLRSKPPAAAQFATDAGVLTPGSWNHIVLVYTSQTRNAVLYTNSTVRGSITLPTGESPGVGGSLYLGYRPAESNEARQGAHFKGRMDEVRIYAGFLTTRQVDSLYAMGAPAAPDSSVTALPAPLARWDFEDSTGTELRDQAGNAHGIITGPLTRAAGKWGKALSLSGTGHVEIPDALINLSGDVTFSTWIWQDSQTADAPVLDFCCSSGYSGMHLWVNTTGNSTIVLGAVQLNLRPNPPNSAGFSLPSGTLPANVWNNLVLTYSAASRKAILYANRIPRDSITLDPGLEPSFTGSLYFGYRSASSADSRRGAIFTGRMDETTIYNAVLTQSQVNSLYFVAPPVRDTSGLAAYWDFNDTSATILKDVTGNAHDGSITGPVAWSNAAPSGKTLYFNGVTKVTVPFDSVLSTLGFTWTVWANPSGSDNRVLMQQQGTGGWPYRRLWISETGVLTMEYGNNSVNGARVLHAPSKLADGVWNHVTVTVTGSTMRVYMNGVLDSMQTFAEAPQYGNAPLVLGGGEVGAVAAPWVGWMDEVRVYRRSLDSAQVKAGFLASYGTPVRDASPTIGTLRLIRSGPSSFSLSGLGKNLTARVDLVDVSGRLVAFWGTVRDGQRLDIPEAARVGARLFRIRVSNGRTLFLRAAWVTP